MLAFGCWYPSNDDRAAMLYPRRVPKSLSYFSKMYEEEVVGSRGKEKKPIYSRECK
jgi:hypothetical protein